MCLIDICGCNNNDETAQHGRPWHYEPWVLPLQPRVIIIPVYQIHTWLHNSKNKKWLNILLGKGCFIPYSCTCLLLHNNFYSYIAVMQCFSGFCGIDNLLYMIAVGAQGRIQTFEKGRPFKIWLAFGQKRLMSFLSLLILPFLCLGNLIFEKG